MGGVISSFQFKSYKIDRFKFEMTPDIELLNLTEPMPSDMWEMGIAFRHPSFFKSQSIYVGGVECSLKCALGNEECKEEANTSDKKILLSLDAGIAGVFHVTEELSKETELKLVKYQIPSILFPYLRGAVTSFLANAGFPGIILPLVNIFEMAKDQAKDLNVEVIE